MIFSRLLSAILALVLLSRLSSHKVRGEKTVSSKVVVLLEDDVDGGEATETIEFGLDGTSYAIDLSDANAKKLRETLDGYVSKARKVSVRRSGRPKTSSGVDSTAVRAWAEANGIEVSKRGRISRDIVSQFRAAGN
jgi:hypothetical protein